MLRPLAISYFGAQLRGYLNIKAICFVIIATFDVHRRRPFHRGPHYFLRQAALCDQTAALDRTRNRDVDERKFSPASILITVVDRTKINRCRCCDELTRPFRMAIISLYR